MVQILSLATAALKPGQANGKAYDEKGNSLYPRVDYIELKRRYSVDVMDYDVYRRQRLGELLGWVETQLRSDLYLAFLGHRRQSRHDMVFAWSERAGIPYAGFRRVSGSRLPFAAMFTCWSDRQEKVITRLNLFEQMDTIAVHCDSMRRHFISLGVPEEKVNLIHYSVDDRFFQPLPDVEPQPGLALSLGESRSRDYPALFSAVADLPLELKVAAAGSWYAREKDAGLQAAPPPNVTLTGRLSQAELRQMYARSQFVVLPLYDEIYSAGATATLEAMSMARPVIAFHSRGIVDFIQDGKTGILVEPGNAEAMRRAICYLLENPEEARRMGKNGRKRVEEDLNLDNYVSRIASWLHSLL
jgi:glycosyltransferase involved in cell wall biosynthesis